MVMSRHVVEQGVQPLAAAQAAGTELGHARFHQGGDFARGLRVVAVGIGNAWEKKRGR